MSWNFTAKDRPKTVATQADTYFQQPYISTMHFAERAIAMNVHQQILLAAVNCEPGYNMAVSAWGSRSSCPSGRALNTVHVDIKFEKAPDTED